MREESTPPLWLKLTACGADITQVNVHDQTALLHWHWLLSARRWDQQKRNHGATTILMIRPVTGGGVTITITITMIGITIITIITITTMIMIIIIMATITTMITTTIMMTMTIITAMTMITATVTTVRSTSE